MLQLMIEILNIMSRSPPMEQILPHPVPMHLLQPPKIRSRGSGCVLWKAVAGERKTTQITFPLLMQTPSTCTNAVVPLIYQFEYCPESSCCRAFQEWLLSSPQPPFPRQTEAKSPFQQLCWKVVLTAVNCFDIAPKAKKIVCHVCLCHSPKQQLYWAKKKTQPRNTLTINSGSSIFFFHYRNTLLRNNFASLQEKA